MLSRFLNTPLVFHNLQILAKYDVSYSNFKHEIIGYSRYIKFFKLLLLYLLCVLVSLLITLSRFNKEKVFACWKNTYSKLCPIQYCLDSLLLTHSSLLSPGSPGKPFPKVSNLSPLGSLSVHLFLDSESYLGK